MITTNNFSPALLLLGFLFVLTFTMPSQKLHKKKPVKTGFYNAYRVIQFGLLAGSIDFEV